MNSQCLDVDPSYERFAKISFEPTNQSSKFFLFLNSQLGQLIFSSLNFHSIKNKISDDKFVFTSFMFEFINHLMQELLREESRIDLKIPILAGNGPVKQLGQYEFFMFSLTKKEKNRLLISSFHFRNFVFSYFGHFSCVILFIFKISILPVLP